MKSIHEAQSFINSYHIHGLLTIFTETIQTSDMHLNKSEYTLIHKQSINKSVINNVVRKNFSYTKLSKPRYQRYIETWENFATQ